MIVDKLGKGAQSNSVKLGYVPENEEFYALKIFRISSLKRKKDYFKKPEGGMGFITQYDRVLKEIEIHSKFDHPYVAKLHEIIEHESGDKLYLGEYLSSNLLVMDYCYFKDVVSWSEKN